MLLEQIERKLQTLKRQLAKEKLLAMAETVEKVAHKVVVIGVATPLELHERMKAFLERTKAMPGAPKTLKQLALLAMTVGMRKMEQSGLPDVGYKDPDDVVEGLISLFDPGWDVDVQRTAESWDIIVPSNAVLADNLAIPETVNGVPVRVVRR